jgi:hypothetical protein
MNPYSKQCLSSYSFSTIYFILCSLKLNLDYTFFHTRPNESNQQYASPPGSDFGTDKQKHRNGVNDLF